MALAGVAADPDPEEQEKKQDHGRLLKAAEE